MPIPIARWNVVPWQRTTGTFNAGVVAFSKAGIQDVTFQVNAESPVVVSTMSLNARTDCWEYWFPIDMSSLPDGPLSVTATVTGLDAQTNVLPTMQLQNNDAGSLVTHEAWVDSANGDDNTGEVNNNTLPYQTLAKAIRGIWDAYGGNTDGGVVYLREGTYQWADPTFFEMLTAKNDWLIVTRDAGAAKANVILQDVDGSRITVSMLKITDITMQYQGTSNGILSSSVTTSPLYWIDQVTGIGSDTRTELANFADGNGTLLYYTNVDCDKFSNPFASSGGLIRNCAATATYIDVLRMGGGLAYNIKIDVIDPIIPGPPPWHSDAMQLETGYLPDVGNVRDLICVNVVARYLHYEGILGNGTTNSGEVYERVAWINCYMEVKDPIRWDGNNGGVGISLTLPMEHVLLWHCTFHYDGIESNINAGITSFYRNSEEQSAGNDTTYSNLDIRGCAIKLLRSPGPGGVQFPDIVVDECNVESLSITSIEDAMTNRTVGQPENHGDGPSGVNGYPTAGSPLIARLAPLVPYDADNVTRPGLASIGAFEPVGLGPAAPTNLTVTVA